MGYKVVAKISNKEVNNGRQAANRNNWAKHGEVV